MSSPTTGLTVYPTPPATTPPVTTGPAWESFEVDFTAMDVGSVLGGTTALDVVGGGTINATSYRDAYADDVTILGGVGLQILPKVNANYNSDTPGIYGIDLRDQWADFDPALDEFAVLVDADCTPMNDAYHGFGVVIYDATGGLPSQRVDAGCLYDGGAQRYRQLIAGGTAYTAGVQRPWVLLHAQRLSCRVAFETAEPVDPTDTTEVDCFSLYARNPGGGANPYTAARTRVAFVALRGPSATRPTITCRKMKFFRRRIGA